MDDQYLDLERLSDYSSLPIPTLRDYIRDLALPCYKPKGKLLVKRSEFDKWLSRFRVTQESLGKIVDDVLNQINSPQVK